MDQIIVYEDAPKHADSVSRRKHRQAHVEIPGFENQVFIRCRCEGEVATFVGNNNPITQTLFYSIKFTILSMSITGFMPGCGTSATHDCIATEKEWSVELSLFAEKFKKQNTMYSQPFVNYL